MTVSRSLCIALALAGCQRPLLGPEPDSGGASEASSGDDSSSGFVEEDDDESGATEPTCHPSYSPCLPLVDDLDCPDVVALGLAPVTLVGADDYGLDADADGIGCEP